MPQYLESEVQMVSKFFIAFNCTEIIQKLKVPQIKDNV